jgi:hypothetical protein
MEIINCILWLLNISIISLDIMKRKQIQAHTPYYDFFYLQPHVRHVRPNCVTAAHMQKKKKKKKKKTLNLT